MLQDYPPCDADDSHVATIHCPDCEENFCIDCDALIHARKKNAGHARQQIELEQPEEEVQEEEPEQQPEEQPAEAEEQQPEEAVEEEPIPCDSDASHVAVMYCEDCEENLCADCDYVFHSRKKTANHLRYEGARRP